MGDFNGQRGNFDYQLRKNLGMIRRTIKDLRGMGMNFEIDKDVETMVGSVVDNVYIVDRMAGRVILKKHILTVYRGPKTREEDQHEDTGKNTK